LNIEGKQEEKSGIFYPTERSFSKMNDKSVFFS